MKINYEYGCSKWCWKFQTGVVQKLCNTKEDAIFYGSQQAEKFNSDLYVERKNGKYVKQKKKVAVGA